MICLFKIRKIRDIQVMLSVCSVRMLEFTSQQQQHYGILLL